ncbi:MAG: sugar ABC transporter permease [Firmicutes bacterium]|nr:sugar ABC transporter permease [Bacillota bacterium]
MAIRLANLADDIHPLEPSLNPRRRLRQAGEWLFLIPGIVTVLAFFIVPAGYVIYISFFQSTIMNPTASFAGVGNYRAILHSAQFGGALVHTLIFAGGVTISVLVLGLLLATLLDQRLRAVSVYRTVIFLPYVFPLVSSGVAFMWLLQPQYGFVDTVLQLLGLPAVNWLGNVHTALLCIIAVTTWEFLGFYTLIFLGGLQNVNVHLKEAAAVDGAGSWTVFRKITVPSITPSIFFAAVFSIIQSFQAFDQIYIMTQGGPAMATQTLTYYIYTQGFQFFNFGQASAASVFMMVLLGLLTGAQFFLAKRWVVTEE